MGLPARRFLFTTCGLALLCLARPAGAQQTPMTRTDTATMKNVELAPAEWTYSPQVKPAKLTDGPIEVPADSADLRATHGALNDAVVPGGLGVLGLQYKVQSKDAKPGQGDTWAVGVVDLSTGKAGPPVALPQGLTARAISPDGSVVAAGSGHWSEPRAAELLLVDVKAAAQAGGQPGGQAAPVKADFVPNAAAEQNQIRWIPWVRFIDNSRFITICPQRIGPQRLVLWQFTGNSVKAVWSITQGRHFSGDPQLTPDLKYLILDDEKGTYFVEAATGKVAGVMSDSASGSWFVNSGLHYAVRPDGRALARVTNARVRVLTLEAGPAGPKQLCDVPLPPKTSVFNVVWAGDGYLLVNGRYLVDVGRNMIVWVYSGLAAPWREDLTVLLPVDGRVVRAVNVKDKMTVAAYRIPDEQVKQTVAGLDSNEVMAVKPGMKVTLDIDIPDRAVAASVKAHLESELKKNKMTVAPDQPLKLRAKLGVFDTEKVEYQDVAHRHTAPPANADVTVKQMSIAYELSGQRLWETTLYASTPFLVTVRPGERLNTAIAKEQDKTWQQVDSLSLPQYVPVLRDPPGFGQTALDVGRR